MAKQSGSTDFASATCPSKATITANVADLNVAEENKTDDQKDGEAAAYAATETDPAANETWADF